MQEADEPYSLAPKHYRSNTESLNDNSKVTLGTVGWKQKDKKNTKFKKFKNTVWKTCSSSTG